MGNNKVYGIHRGSVHEGGGMGYNIYTDPQTVRSTCKDLVNDEQKMDNELYGDSISSGECPIHRWEEVDVGRWTNGVEEIKIQEMELHER